MRQKYGQHFLSDHTIARRIVEAAELDGKSAVLEIGPGKGVLTDMLAARCAKLTAVEIDALLDEKLQTRFANKPNVEIVRANFLDFELHSGNQPVTIISNLPYYVATAIIEHFLPWQGWSSAVVMVQHEVGARICASVNSCDYGYYSLLCQYYADCKIIFTVLPGSFSPAPKVNSAVVRLINKFPQPPAEGVFNLIKHVFAHRRKTMLNALSLGTERDKETLKPLIQKAGISPSLRPQNLSWEDYFRLQQALTNR